MLPAGAAGLLPQVLDRVLEPDVRLAGPRSPLRATHRRIGGREVYFVINDSASPWSGRVRPAAAGPGEQCDPATGEVRPFNPGAEIHLSAYGGTVFRFPAGHLPRRLKLTDAALPDVARPLVERFAQLLRDQGIPTGQGEFGAHMLVEIHNDGPVTIWLEK